MMIEQALIEYLANAFWQVPLLVAGAWLLLRVVRPGPAAQYRIWLGVLGVALLLPLHGSLYGVPQVDAVGTQPVAAEQMAAVSSEAVGSSAAEAIGEPGGLVLGRELRGDGPSFSWLMFPARVRRVQLNAVAVHGIVGLYMAVVLFGLFRIARSWRVARHLVEDSRKAALSDRERAALDDCSRRFGVPLPEVRESREISGPVVVGAVAPVLLWPENFANHSDDELMAVLCHEMAHIRRRDYLVNLVCEAAALPLTWHPAIYGVQRRIRGTREMVCDQMAADAMQSEMAYAKCLLSLAQSMVSGSGLAERAQVPGLLSGNVLEERVMRLMQGKTVMSVRAKVARGAVGAAAMMIPIALAAIFHVVPTMAQSDAAQKVTGGVQGGVVDGVQGRIQQGVRDGVADGVVTPEVKVRPAAPEVKVRPAVPEVKVRPISPVVKVSPVVTVAPLEKLAMVSPVVKVAPMVKVPPVVTVTPVVKVKPLGDLMTVSPVIHVTPEIKMLPEVQVAPESQEKPKGATSGANGSSAGTRLGHGAGSASGSGQGTRHRMYAVVNGQQRELAPEEQQRVERQLDVAQKQIAAATARLNSPEFKAQMEKSQRDAEEAMRKLNSGEFQKQMADAQKQVAEATAKVNSPEFRKQVEEAAQAASKIDSAKFQAQMADAQKQVAEATAKVNSPEFRKQIEEAAQAASKIDSAELQKQMADAQRQIADAIAKMKADQAKQDKNEPK